MKFSVGAIIYLATLSDVFAQTGTKSTKSVGKSTKTAKSSKVTSAPVTSHPVSKAPSSAPITSAPVTSAPITSSPTSAALAYSPIGSGECVDGRDNVYSQFGIFSFPNITVAECSAKCIADFDHPHLVGFGTSTTAGEQSCFCYYSGGVTPSLPVPNGMEYYQYLHGGNGPIMSTKPRQGWNCFGTGSPITSGATKAPITPSPTGVVTPAPTPCQDSSGNSFDYVGGGIGTVTAPECSKFCGQFASSDLLGFSLKLGGTLNCFCHFPDGKIPQPPSGSNWDSMKSDFVGSGPITQSTSAGYECYVYPQGSASPVASPV
eukprot:scaffold18014_cov69-Cyclotella_meneghiniana.AAC.1